MSRVAGKKNSGFVQRLGAAISKERKRLEMTQGELAKRTGLHPVAVSKIERGIQGDLGCKTLWRIAHALRTRGHILYAMAETVTIYGDRDEP